MKNELDAFDYGLKLIEDNKYFFGVWYKGKLIDTLEVSAPTGIKAFEKAKQEVSDKMEVDIL